MKISRPGILVCALLATAQGYLDRSPRSPAGDLPEWGWGRGGSLDSRIDHFRKALACCSPSTRHISLYYLALAYEAVANAGGALKTWEEYFRICPKGTNWETEAKKHYAILRTAPVPALTP